MIDIVFLKALRDKLKGGNTRSIHLNALPGRYAARLDLANLNHIQPGVADSFLHTLLTRASFEFKLSFDQIDLNSLGQDEQKNLGLLSKRLDSIFFENEDYFKEHGTKTFGFGYPLIIKPSKNDPKKIIKAPLFIWPLEMFKSSNRVNTWSILRNKQKNEQGKIVDEEIHSVGLNEVFVSFVKTDEDISIAKINEDLLEDTIIDRTELIDACIAVLEAMNADSAPNIRQSLMDKLQVPIETLPDAKWIESVTSNKPWIHFGGVFGLFRAQKESIITDIDLLIEKFDNFSFDELKSGISGHTFSAIETDPTQQEILNSLSLEPKKIIQGPPGTGKSQTLTALITNALENGYKCLVVCEKKTALEVIQQNLNRENEQLGELSALIEDIQSDRDSIVNSVRDRINVTNSNGYFNQTNYTTRQESLAATVLALNQQHTSLDRKIWQGKTWTEIVGLYLKKSIQYLPDLLKGKLDFRWFSFSNNSSEMTDTVYLLKKGEALWKHVNALEHPLDILHDRLFQHPNFFGLKEEAEDRANNLVNRSISLQKDLTSHRQPANEWHQSIFTFYPNYLQSSVREWQRFMTGNLLLPEVPLPESLPLESLCASWRSQQAELSFTIQEEINQYRNWLKNHYADYYQPLQKAINDYLVFFKSETQIHGERFYRNKGFDRFLTTLFSFFSQKKHRLKTARKKVVEQLTIIIQAFQQHSYFAHQFPLTEKIDNLRKLQENVQQLNEVAGVWYSEIDQTIKILIDEASSGQLHALYKHRSLTIANQTKDVHTLVGYVNRVIEDAAIVPGNKLVENLNTLQSVSTKSREVEERLREFRHVYHLQRTASEAFVKNIIDLQAALIDPPLLIEQFTRPNTSEECHSMLSRKESLGRIVQQNIETAREYYEWRRFLKDLTDVQKKIVQEFIASGCSNWANQFESWYLSRILLIHEDRDLPRDDSRITNYQQEKIEFRNIQLKSILSRWQKQQFESVRRTISKGINPTTLYNKRGSKGERRNSLRRIIGTDFELFTDFYPIVMVNPTVCSSILPLQEGIFDIVIFDEASQLRLEDTFAGLIRGKVKVVSGDSQQMPPSSYFQGGSAIIDPHEEELEETDEDQITLARQKIDNSLNLADSESLLVFAENSGYRQSYLKIHYRSQHPALIDFSNNAFYGKRLVPMPAKSAYTPIHFIQVNGRYEEQTNKDEAQRVIDILLHQIHSSQNGQYPSVGIATFNLHQRNLILEEITKVRQSNPAYDQKIESLGPSLFVKNLENIQGDERDIIIISTTFGRNAEGKFRQNFGPIIQRNGYKLLNVIVTRAKTKVFVCTSIPDENIQQFSVLLQAKGNHGRAALYAYLAYAKAVHERNDEQVTSILRQLFDNCENKMFDVVSNSLGSESPFEEEVCQRLSERIESHRIEQQYRIGGFRIDLVIHPETPGGPIIAVECDGAKYHSSMEAYAWDSFRQHELEKHGFVFYRIWSTNWWISPESELKKLLEFIHVTNLGGRSANQQ